MGQHPLSLKALKLHVYSIHIVTYRSKFLYSEKLRVVMNSDIVMLKHAELLIKETLKIF